MEGVYLAVGMVAIYVIFGPLVLLGLYIFFDRLAEREPNLQPATRAEEKDVSLWTHRDAERYLKQGPSRSSV